MNCPHGGAITIRKRSKKMKLGSITYFCPQCRSIFNERTGTPFNHLEFPTDVVLLAVLWRLRYKLSLRDVAELFLERGIAFTHEAVREWEARFARCLPISCEQNGTDRQEDPGLLMRRLSKLMENGAICIEPLIMMAISLLRR